MAVLLTPPFLQFLDDEGDPLVGGKIFSYAAGTTTPKATFTTAAGDIENTNPIILDSSGRAVVFIQGSYRFDIFDANDVLIKSVPNITSFTTLAEAGESFFQSFSGNGTQTAFTLSEEFGVDSKALMVFVSNGLEECVDNGDFATDTIWTKGTGWTIGSGVATATGAISTGISQTSVVTLVQGQAYRLTYTITRSAGGIIPSIGGRNGTERTASGTYTEVIVADSTQSIAFTGNAFTGTLDNVFINIANPPGFEIQDPSSYTLSGTSLTFASAPATGTNNIYVFAPSLLLGAASAAAEQAIAAEAGALQSELSAAAYAVRNKWVYSNNTSMADPSTGNIRFNNATPASATAVAISDLTNNTSNPDVGAWLDTFGDGSGGVLQIFKDESNFLLFNVTADTDNTTWHQLTVTNLVSAGSISNSDVLYIGFDKSGVTTFSGTVGDGDYGDVTVSSSGTVWSVISDLIAAKTSAGMVIEAANGTDSFAFGVGNTADSVSYGNISMNTTGKVVNMADPTSAQDAATKAYVDDFGIQQATKVTLSGTAQTVTGIPATAKRVTVAIASLSTNGTSIPTIRIGDSGGVEATGYLGSGSQVAGTLSSFLLSTGFNLTFNWSATRIISGVLTLEKEEGTNLWCCSATFGEDSGSAVTYSIGGNKTLSDVLDRVSLTTAGGSDTFDSGTMTVSWEV